jgi:hypothetical protein
MNNIRRMIILLIISFSGLLAFSGSANARFEKHVCSKPKFSAFKPGDRAEVAPGSTFSFRAPGDIAKNSVVATVKGIKVDLTVEDRTDFYYFKGSLPAELKDTYARIKVNGQVNLGCKGSNGWLIKITGADQ